jgi:hypothetical protein
MQFNIVLDVVLGLVVLFWIVATSSSFIVEAMSSFLNVRGKVLELYVREMVVGSKALASARQKLKWFPRSAGSERPTVSSPVGAEPDSVTLTISDHPLIRRLAKPQSFLSGDDTPPSYIPSDLFAKALIDRLRQAYGALLTIRDVTTLLRTHLPNLSATAALIRNLRANTATATQSFRALAAAAARLPQAVQGIDDALRSVSPESAAARVLKILRDHIASGGQDLDDVWPELSDAIRDRGALGIDDLLSIVSSGGLPEPLAAAIRPLLDAANHDIDAFRKLLAGWFDNVMDRATGWFRRYTQWWLGFVALAIACALNLDAIYIGQRLVADREARDAAVRMGQTIVVQGDKAGHLPLAYALREQYKDGGWLIPLLTSADPLTAAESLARQVQPYLVASGRLTEPMIALQAAALSMSRRCPSAETEGRCSPAQLARDWEALLPERKALAAGLCRAELSAPSSTASDRDWAARRNDSQLLTDADADAARPRCGALRKLALKEGSAAADVLAIVSDWWASSAVTWSPDLAGAAWNVRKAAARPGANDAETILKLRETMQAALDKARTELQSADDLLARMPYVGSLNAMVSRWRQPGLSTSDLVMGIPLNVLGWIITALMASLGAPTWFDLLNKLVNRRITGPKPEQATSGEG